MEIRVDCHAGYRGEETPRQLTMGERRIAVVAVQDRWLAPDHRYFKVIGDDRGMYIIRHDPRQDKWQLTCFKSDPCPAPTLIAEPDATGLPTC
ncbi:hypothetical protein DSCA_08900 [Desulfosarcina alkanivorans]|uniref:DUF3892 domain-containing protein n=1 Tax=Desulfosarcina alkanivorans TaxID=571177 RepID=A0A5K7YFY0_9BACT|nr:hypothetical protein [Desulfosarcina alkanivorans]BBO66960.1 hypothetical protein DSCA_08900 [Desulfosarcina alkanivorans]